MFLIFLIPVFWFISLPLILKILSGIAFVILGTIWCYQYYTKKKAEKIEEDRKYERFFEDTNEVKNGRDK